eukprot:9951128-Alexandrium_andersonii.AAC.1
MHAVAQLRDALQLLDVRHQLRAFPPTLSKLTVIKHDRVHGIFLFQLAGRASEPQARIARVLDDPWDRIPMAKTS